MTHRHLLQCVLRIYRIFNSTLPHWLLVQTSKNNQKNNRIEKRKQKLDFSKLGISDQLVKTLTKIGYEKPTPIQAALIPVALDGFDVIGQAQTGTGKTAAFSIPILEFIDLRIKAPQALILAPTRELAIQVEKEIQRLSSDIDVTSCCLYGGRPIKKQINTLKKGVQIIVGTPGRVIDHLSRGTLDPRGLWCVVLDEADRMLDIGFRPDIERILRKCPKNRQTLLLSATVPDQILRLVRRYMDCPKRINFSNKHVSAETIDQFYVNVPQDMKYDILLKLLEREKPEQSIIFCRTKLGTERLYRKLIKSTLDTKVGTIHGDMSQSARGRMMTDFRSGKINCLVATDVVGRGIDISNISHIINYDIPELSEDYVHRVGRTGRMGKTGVAYSFVTPGQGEELTRIEQTINRLLDKDKIQEFIDEQVSARTPEKSASTARPKKKYRRAL